MSRSPAMSRKAIAMKSLNEKWLSMVQSATEKGENATGGSSIVTVPSMFRAWRGGIGCEGRRRRLTRDGSIKFPVAPQLTRAVVTMVLAPCFRQIGNQIARSD